MKDPPDRDGTGFEVACYLKDCGLEPIDYLKDKKKGNYFGDLASDYVIIGGSRPMKEVYETIGKLSKVRYPVLITGERGTGKELAARMLHELYENKHGKKPFVKVNCAAIPEGLLESELFGHEKGSFTGADRKREGSFKLADGGILFLDEIGDAPLYMQEKILTAIEYGEIKPVGWDSPNPIIVDVRTIAATNKDIENVIGDGKFKEDLHDRLAIGIIELPPLIERDGDISLLAIYLLGKHSEEYGIKHFSGDALHYLESQTWPGNVREMDNLIKRTATMVEGSEINENHLRKYSKKIVPRTVERGDFLGMCLEKGMNLHYMKKAAEKEYIERTLTKTNDAAKAAKLLGMNRSYLYSKIRKYGLEKHF